MCPAPTLICHIFSRVYDMVCNCRARAVSGLAYFCFCNLCSKFYGFYLTKKSLFKPNVQSRFTESLASVREHLNEEQYRWLLKYRSQYTSIGYLSEKILRRNLKSSMYSSPHCQKPIYSSHLQAIDSELYPTTVLSICGRGLQVWSFYSCRRWCKLFRLCTWLCLCLKNILFNNSISYKWNMSSTQSHISNSCPSLTKLFPLNNPIPIISRFSRVDIII